MNKTKKTLLSLTAIAISAGIVVGGTYALFTSKATVNNHVQAGSLKVGMSRVGYTQYIPDDDGLMHEVFDDTDIDLVQSAQSVFAVENAVPGCWYEAEISVTNENVVAFTHGVRILWDEEKATEKQAIFASQMEITVTYDGGEKSFLLTECELQKNEVDLGLLLKDESKSFTVKAAFLDQENNNAVQEEKILFDVQVFAVQYLEQEQE